MKQFLKVDPFWSWMQVLGKANRTRDKRKKAVMGQVSTCVDSRAGRVLSRAFYDTSICNLKNEVFDLRLNTLESLLLKKKKQNSRKPKCPLFEKHFFFATSPWSQSYILKRVQWLQSCWRIDKVCCCHDLLYPQEVLGLWYCHFWIVQSGLLSLQLASKQGTLLF